MNPRNEIGAVAMSMQFKAENFAMAKAVQPSVETGAEALARSQAVSLQFWSGVSGKRYVHTVFDLITCPRLPACSYVLVRRDAKGNRKALRIGTVCADAWSLNLAEIRHRAAKLGANEVHAHLIAAGASGRSQVAEDMQAGQFAELSAEPSARPRHLC
jgi:hypothetical protein